MTAALRSVVDSVGEVAVAAEILGVPLAAAK
jgi:hypothetical protein